MYNYIKSFWTRPTDDHAEEEFRDKPRFTYRSDFVPIPNTSITSDVGWGCCYRCCQGIIAQYLRLIQKDDPHILAKRFTNSDALLTLFEDTLEAPFSIQNLVKETQKTGVSPGEWAKPSQVALAFGNIFDYFDLHHYVSLNCIIEPSKINKIEYPMILMVSLMCGLQQFDETLFPFMKFVFSLPETIGIVSGYSGSAYYVVNINESEEVFYFDPHVVQQAAVNSESFDSFFNQKLNNMSLAQLNPSILLCFVCRNKESTDQLIKCITEFPKSPVSFSEFNEDVLDKVMDIDDLDLS